MNDRYLYKAKRVDNGQWVTGYYLKKKCTDYQDVDNNIQNEIHFIYNETAHTIIPDTVSQWIVNEDNQDIFEGDEIEEWSHDILIRTFIAESVRTLTREYDKAPHSAIWKLTGKNIHDERKT